MTEWTRAEAVFEEAIELPDAERPQFLEQACGSDRRLRTAVESLLAAHDSADGPLDRPLFSSAPALESDEGIWSGHILLERYRIERFLARGGMSTVYLAHDQQLAGKTVIVKFLHAWARQHDWLKDKFRQEMEALSRINHPAVVGVLDIGDTADGLPFLVIEYVDGVTLRAEMASGPMALDRVARIIRETGQAVEAAHGRRVLHRDLKPENIMLERPGTPDERVRLIDFGIARLQETPGVVVTTRLTQFAGTRPYMAPEQLRGKPLPASDVYALGVIVFEMLTGGRPFPAESPVELYEEQRAGINPGSLRAAGVPETAARLIVKQLSFRPEDRSRSAREAADGIANALLHPDRRVWPRRRAMVAVAGGMVATVIGGSAWRSHLNNSGEVVRIVEKVGAFDPLREGFEIHSDIRGTVTDNPTRTGYDGWSILTHKLGYYFHSFTTTQKRRALEQGWKMTAVMKVEEGMLTAGVDFTGVGDRFDINLLLDGDREIVRLLTQIVPEIRGLEIVQRPARAYHRYELVYDASLRSADLWIDGQRRLANYHGHGQFLEDRGLLFGGALYKSDRGSGSFQSVRFEINP